MMNLIRRHYYVACVSLDCCFCGCCQHPHVFGCSMACSAAAISLVDTVDVEGAVTRCHRVASVRAALLLVRPPILIAIVDSKSASNGIVVFITFGA